MRKPDFSSRNPLTIILCAAGAAVLAVGVSAAEEWRVGEAAPAQFRSPGSLVVVVESARLPRSLEDAAAELRSRGVQIVVQGREPAKVRLIDEDGALRRQGEIPPTSDELLDFVKSWEDGRVVFRNRCARCHGMDGMETGYPYIKQLGGIGRRWTTPEIRKKLNPAGEGGHMALVRGEQFPSADYDALIAYVAGL